MSHDEYDILVFHEKETETLLEKLNLLEKVNAGQVTCIACNKTITKENFGGLFEKRNRIFMVCDDLKCLEKARELRNAT